MFIQASLNYNLRYAKRYMFFFLGKDFEKKIITSYRKYDTYDLSKILISFFFSNVNPWLKDIFLTA